MMNVPLYIGDKKKKDMIVASELSRFTEGNRCDRVKDLILKGLIWEGRKDIPKQLLEAKYAMVEVPPLIDKGIDVNLETIMQISATKDNEPPEVKTYIRSSGLNPPNFGDTKLEKKHTSDKDLENKI